MYVHLSVSLIACLCVRPPVCLRVFFLYIYSDVKSIGNGHRHFYLCLLTVGHEAEAAITTDRAAGGLIDVGK